MASIEIRCAGSRKLADVQVLCLLMALRRREDGEVSSEVASSTSFRR